MSRPDLLALSHDDLAALSTRGKVKEALRDLDAGDITGELSERPDGTLHVRWNDGRWSELPPKGALRAGRCACGAVEPCKHLVRLVLLYQRQRGTATAVMGPWDPGEISDAELRQYYRPATLARLRRQFDAGILAELVRGTRPVAHLQVPHCRVRFLVPGDVRFTQCGCAGAAPCEHVALAVWAFRALPADRPSGIISAGAEAPPVPADLLDEMEAVAHDWVGHGVAGVGQGGADRLARLVPRCEASDLIWPAEILRAVQQQWQAHADQDARFEPVAMVALLGELVVRLDAIRTAPPGLPQRLVRGTTADRDVKVGFGEYLGLGCEARPGRQSTTLAVYFFDPDSLGVVAFTRVLLRAEGRSVAQLGQQTALQGLSFHALGRSLLQVQGGRRSAARELIPGRSPCTVREQDRLAWEEVPPPVGSDDFAELESRLDALPPSALRPRRLSEDVHVLTVAETRAAGFDAARQTVTAQLVDRAGRVVLLEHPYTTIGQGGAEALLGALAAPGARLRWVSGRVRRTARGLVVEPFGVVLEQAGQRRLVQPWIDLAPVPTGRHPVVVQETSAGQDPLRDYLAELEERLGDLVVAGLGRADDQLAQQWRALGQRGAELGFARFVQTIEALTRLIEQRVHTVRWDPGPARRSLLRLLGLVRLARDLAG
ncbi:MAG: SWIM zinc finger family protein [Gemmataceae bacterium]